RFRLQSGGWTLSRTFAELDDWVERDGSSSLALQAPMVTFRCHWSKFSLQSGGWTPSRTLAELDDWVERDGSSSLGLQAPMVTFLCHWSKYCCPTPTDPDTRAGACGATARRSP